MSASTGQIPAVRFSAVSKSFGSTAALTEVTLDVAAGDIHALVGENGAGKSTLAKILAGEVSADSGRIQIAGTDPNPRNPRDSARRGVGMVHQEFLLAPDLTVWENVVLGWEGNGLGVSERAATAAVGAVMDRYALPVPLRRRLGDLPIAVQQRVEIVKALYRGARILILDEPTAVLTPHEAEGLFAAMRHLKDQGKTLIFVSHKLKEVLAVADGISILRGGELIDTVPAGNVSEHQLAAMIIGRELEPVRRVGSAPTSVALEVTELAVPPSEGSTGLNHCSFTVHRGEVVGIAGVSGNGQDELVEILCGHRSARRGAVRYPGLTSQPDSGRAPDRGVTPAGSLREAGLSYIPADRAGTGSAPGEPLWFSSIVGRALPRAWWSPMRVDRAKQDADRIRSGYGVRAERVTVTPDQLSGGNLQKFIVGREINRDPAVLIAFEPTRGIDIGSARDLRDRFRALALEGAAVVLVSSDLDELLETSDRLLVLGDGAIRASFDPATATPAQIGLAMTSHLDKADQGAYDGAADTSAGSA